MSLDRDELAVRDLGLAVTGAEHDRDVGPVNIGIHDAYAGTVSGERHRQVDGDGRFADTALAGRDGNDIPHALDRNVVADPASLRHLGVHRDRDACHTGQSAYELDGLRFHFLFDRARGRSKHNAKRHIAVLYS